MPQTTPEEILDQAADYIHEHGWCRGVSKDSEGRVCLEGAFVAIAEDARLAGEAEAVDAALLAHARLAQDAWRAMSRVTGCSPISWNDNVCRDADEAIEVLKKAKEFL